MAPFAGTTACATARDFKKVTVVNDVKLDVDPIHFGARTQAGTADLIPAGSVQLPAFTWDSGLAGL